MSEDKLHVMAESVRAAYAAGEEDEALLPRVLTAKDGKAIGRIGTGPLPSVQHQPHKGFEHWAHPSFEIPGIKVTPPTVGLVLK